MFGVLEETNELDDNVKYKILEKNDYFDQIV
jgi:hypothetical protein